MNVAEATEIGIQAGTECLDKAESVGFDSQGARKFILETLKTQGKSSGETLVDAAKAAGFVPHDDRAFGPIFYWLSHRGFIRIAGEVPRSKGHGAPGCRIWEAA